MATLGELAKLVRSKNAGPFWLTIDIMFDDAEAYRRARDAEIVNRAAIARLYRRNPADIIVVNHDAALAIKVSFPRPQSSGSKHDSDAYGGQQYAPLLGLEVPVELSGRSACERNAQTAFKQTVSSAARQIAHQPPMTPSHRRTNPLAREGAHVSVGTFSTR